MIFVEGGGRGVDSLIKEKPTKSLQMSLAVPVYNEYANGNIFRHIESLTRQTVPTSQWEAAFFVNNTPEDVRYESEGYQDNQNCLKMLRCITDGELIPSEITGYRRSVIENAVQKKVKIHVVDLSTKGIEQNMGLIRDTATQEMIGRFSQTTMGQDGIIAQMDADSVVEPRYIEKVLRHFQDESIDSLFIPVKSFNPEGRLNLHVSTFFFQFKVLSNLFKKLQHQEKLELYSPQIIARARAYEKIGGVPHESSAEDHALSAKLAKETRFSVANDIRMYMADRARVDSYLGGSRRYFLNEGVYDNPDEEVDRWSYESIRARLQRMATYEGKQPDEAEIEVLFAQYGMKFDKAIYKSTSQPIDDALPYSRAVLGHIRRYWDAARMPVQAAPAQSMQEIMDYSERNFGTENEQLRLFIKQEEVQQRIRHSLDRSVIFDAVDGIFQKNKSQEDKSEKMAEFEAMNPELLEVVNGLSKRFTSAQQAKDALKQSTPEWCEDFDKSRMRKTVARLQGIVNFFMEAKANPDKYPQASSFLASSLLRG